MYRYLLLLGLLIALFYAPSFTTTTSADIEDGLWMYLPLDEGTGDTVKDHGPNRFEAEMSDKAPKWVNPNNKAQGRMSNALEFDGGDNFVKIDMQGQGNDINSHTEKNEGLSICAWVKVLDVGTDAHGQTRQPIVMKGFSAGGWEFSLYVYDDFGAGMSVWNCGGSGVSEPSAPGTLPKGEWHHHCGTFLLGEGVKVYVDADPDPVAEAADNGNGPCDGDRPVFIAHREDGQWLNAAIGEVMMWNRVIDPDEMAQSMNTIGGLPVYPTGKLTTTWGKIKRRE